MATMGERYTVLSSVEKKKFRKELLSHGKFICGRCLKVRSTKHFYRDSNSWSGLRHTCIDCAKFTALDSYYRGRNNKNVSKVRHA
jgi:hypothetical protein